MTTSPVFTLDPSQEAAVDLVCSARFGVVTGGPGTGKTTCLRTALDRLDAAGARYLLGAPTGKAARRMREATGRHASTVHRLLDFGPDLLTGELRFRRDRDNVIDADLVVIDEASMLDVDLARALVDAIDPLATRLVLVGDAHQLPSVGPGRVFGDLIVSGAVPVARLTTLHRAAAETWVCSQAPVILGGALPDLRARRDFRWLEHEDRAQAIDALIGAVFRDLPALEVPPTDVQVLIPQRVGPCGCNRANARLQELLNPERDSDPAPWTIGKDDDARRLRLRDRVIQTRNDYTLSVANGEVGEIVEILNEPSSCRACAGTGRSTMSGDRPCAVCGGSGKRPPLLVVRYPDDGAAAGAERRVEYGKGDAFALDLAYALTVHKSQGSQWPWVVVFAHSTHTRMLTRQLLYTAITRAQKGVVLVGDLSGLGRAVKETRDARRNTWLAQELRDAAPLTTEQRETIAGLASHARAEGDHEAADYGEALLALDGAGVESAAPAGGAEVASPTGLAGAALSTPDDAPAAAELAKLFPM